MQPLLPHAKQFQAVGFGEGLHETGNLVRRQNPVRGRLADSLPPFDPVVVEASHIGKEREREQTGDLFRVSLEDGEQIGLHADPVTDILQKPDVTIQAIDILPLIGWSSTKGCGFGWTAKGIWRGQVLHSADIPPGGEG